MKIIPKALVGLQLLSADHPANPVSTSIRTLSKEEKLKRLIQAGYKDVKIGLPWGPWQEARYKELNPVTKTLNKAAKTYKKLKKAVATPYTTNALDEMGHPIMLADGKIATRNSTPAKDITAAVTGITLPISLATMGPTATIGGVIGGAATGYAGSKAGEFTAKALGGNEDALEMGSDIGSFAGSYFGFKPGVRTAYTVTYPINLYRNFTPKTATASDIVMKAGINTTKNSKYGVASDDLPWYTSITNTLGIESPIVGYLPWTPGKYGAMQKGMQAVGYENRYPIEIHFGEVNPKGILTAKEFVENLPSGTVFGPSSNHTPIESRIGNTKELIAHLKDFKSWELPWRLWEVRTDQGLVPASGDAIRLGGLMGANSKVPITAHLSTNYYQVGTNDHGKSGNIVDLLIKTVYDNNGSEESMNALNNYLQNTLKYQIPATFTNGQVRIPYTYFIRK